MNRFTPTELAAIDLVRHHQIGTKSEPTELLICLDRTGSKVIDAKVGSSQGVPLTPQMLAASCPNVGCRLIHNHPREGSLSQYDWELLLSHQGILEIVAVNSQGSTFRGAILDRCGLQAIVKQIDGHRDAVECAVSAQAGGDPKRIDIILELEWLWGDIINERLAAKNLITYAPIYASHDCAVRADTQSAIYLKIARATAACRIP
jgi:hypothetical protein